jgi:hypothetical protein
MDQHCEKFVSAIINSLEGGRVRTQATEQEKLDRLIHRLRHLAESTNVSDVLDLMFGKQETQALVPPGAKRLCPYCRNVIDPPRTRRRKGQRI